MILLMSVTLISCNQLEKEFIKDAVLLESEETKNSSEQIVINPELDSEASEDDKIDLDGNVHENQQNNNGQDQDSNDSQQSETEQDTEKRAENSNPSETNDERSEVNKRSTDESEITEENQSDDTLNEGQTATPTFENLPDDASYEAMVLVHSGATVHAQPDTTSEKNGNLIFGAHVFAISDEEEMTYVYSDGLEGWVHQSQINEIPYDSSEKIEVEDPNDILVLVNKQYRLPADYEPSDLVIPNVRFPFEEDLERKYMREVAAIALEELFAESEKTGLNLFATSGYRSFSRQQQIFPNNVNKVGFTEANVYSAFPGESEHQTGLAMDVTSHEVNFRLTESFGTTDEGIWIRENAHKFGYIIRYPEGKEHITGYTYEPWHLRYVGKEAAKEIFEHDLTLEEYLEKRGKQGDGSPAS